MRRFNNLGSVLMKPKKLMSYTATMVAILLASISCASNAMQGADTAITAGHSMKCLDLPNGLTSDNVPINQFSCDNSQAQLFSFFALGNGYYNIAPKLSGKCLDVPDGSHADNLVIQQFRCDNSPEQRFFLKHVGNGYYNFIASHSGKCLDVPGASTEDNVSIEQFQCDGSREQMFYVLPQALAQTNAQIQSPTAQPRAVQPQAIQPRVVQPRVTQQPRQRQMMSPNAQFLNDWAVTTRSSAPLTIDIFQVDNIYSKCPSGCEVDFADTFLAFELTMPRHTKFSMPFNQVVQRVTSVFAPGYCTETAAVNRKINARFMVSDMNGDLVASTLVEPNDCVALSGSQPVQQRQPQVIARYPLTSNNNDVSGISNSMSLKGVVFDRNALYSFGQYDANAASAYPKNWDLTRFSISAQFFVNNDLGRSRPVFITGHRWLGYYLEQDGTVSMSYNNSQSVRSNTRYSFNQWHTATVIYENGIAYFYLDGNIAGSQRINFDFVNRNPTPSIGITDGSNGAVFKGWIKELTVSNR